MLIVVLLAVLVVAVLTLVSLIKDKKALNITKKKVQELTSYTAEHIQALELEGVSVSDDLEVAKTKLQKLNKSFKIKLVIFILLAVVFYIVI